MRELVNVMIMLCVMFIMITDNDDNNYVPAIPLSRASQDSVCNAFGMKILDICKSSGMCNGHIGQAYDCGMYTFASPNGTSVIDLLLARECDFSLLTNFSIGTVNEYSDHASLLFSLKCNICIAQPQPTNDIKSCWNSTNKTAFHNGIIGKLPLFNLVTHNIDISSRESVNNVIKWFTEIVREVILKGIL